MYSKPAKFAGIAALAAAVTFGCTRRPAAPLSERLAILRFENLGQDVSDDWMGRAFAEIITTGLSNTPGISVIPSGRLHALNPALGVRPISAPGISSERTMAIAAGANRIGYGDYSVVNGRLFAHLTIEDPQTGKTVQAVSTSVAAGDAIGAATGLARRLSDRATPYGTTNPRAVQAWVAALEARDPAALPNALQQAIAADPDFGPPYRALAQWKAQRQDPAGALAVLQQALARGDRISEAERARIGFEIANLRNDGPGRERALAALTRLDPRDAGVWTALAQTAFGRRQFAQAVQAYQKALELDPDNIAACNQLGYAAAYAGDLDTAVRALRRYEALRPTDPNPLDSLGDVHLIAGRLREAETFYLEAAKKNPNFLYHAEYFKAAMARLMAGDIGGADVLAKQYADARAAARDPLADYYRAQWSWISGRRQAAYDQLTAFAGGAGAAAAGESREAASRACSQLAIWSLMLGDRAAAQQMAGRSASLAGPSTTGLSIAARFLAEPPASPAEWAARAERLFPNPTQSSARDLTLAYALLLDRQFQPASLLLKRVYDGTAPNSDEGVPILLAWTLLETGRSQDAAPLLGANPVPQPTGVGLMMSFHFPRIYDLRARVAESQGKSEQARASRQLFLQLSGPVPLLWDRERPAGSTQ